MARWKSATWFGNFAVRACSCFDFVVSILRSSGQFTNTYESSDLRPIVPRAKAVTQTNVTRPDNPTCRTRTYRECSTFDEQKENGFNKIIAIHRLEFTLISNHNDPPKANRKINYILPGIMCIIQIQYIFGLRNITWKNITWSSFVNVFAYTIYPLLHLLFEGYPIIRSSLLLS